jgi:hypothetical protein
MRSCTLPFFSLFFFLILLVLIVQHVLKSFVFFMQMRMFDLWILMQSEVWILSPYIFYIKLFISKITCYFIILVFNIFFILRQLC